MGGYFSTIKGSQTPYGLPVMASVQSLSSNPITGIPDAPSVIPNGIIAYAAISLSNNQSSSTKTPYDQELYINSSLFSTVEANNLQNVEWFTNNGNIVPSWIEAGDSNFAKNTIYWLKIPFSIGPDSSDMIYMGFVSTSANLFNKTGDEGLAPQLTSLQYNAFPLETPYNVNISYQTYGAYDNGKNVFPIYFNGNSMHRNFDVHSGINLYNGTPVLFGNKTIFATEITGTTSQRSGGWVYVASSLTGGNVILVASVLTTNQNTVETDIWNTNNVNSTSMSAVGIGTTSSGATDSMYVQSGSWGLNQLTPTSPTGWVYLNEYTQGGTNYVCIVNNLTEQRNILLYSSYANNPVNGASTLWAGGYWADADGNPMNIFINYERVCYAPPNGIMPGLNYISEVFTNTVGYQGNNTIYMTKGFSGEHLLLLGNQNVSGGSTGIGRNIQFTNESPYPQIYNNNSLLIGTGRNISENGLQTNYSFGEYYVGGEDPHLNVYLPVTAIGTSATTNEGASYPDILNNFSVWNVNLRTTSSGLSHLYNHVELQALSGYAAGHNFSDLNKSKLVNTTNYGKVYEGILSLLAGGLTTAVLAVEVAGIISTGQLELLTLVPLSAGAVSASLDYFLGADELLNDKSTSSGGWGSNNFTNNLSEYGGPVNQNYSIIGGKNNSLTAGYNHYNYSNKYIIHQYEKIQITSQDFGEHGYINTSGTSILSDRGVSGNSAQIGAVSHLNFPVVPGNTLHGSVWNNGLKASDQELVIKQTGSGQIPVKYFFTKTDSNGNYRFIGYPGMHYEINESMPFGLSVGNSTSISATDYGSTWLNLSLADATIQGYVYNGYTGSPLQEASVTASDSSYSGDSYTVYTNSNGYYSIEVFIAGTYDITASYDGFSNGTTVDVTAINNSTYSASQINIRMEYLVTFKESGLYSGNVWHITVGSNSYSPVGSTESFYLPDGTYSFSVSAEGYTATPSSGTITVAGSALTETTSFSPNSYTPVKITVHVLNTIGDPASGASVDLMYYGHDWTGTTDSNGDHTFSNLMYTGDYTIDASLSSPVESGSGGIDVTSLNGNTYYKTVQLTSVSNGCVLYGTMIMTSQNNAVPVQDLSIGSKILSYDTTDGKLVEEKVTGINVTNVSSIFNINNGLLYVSGATDQPIYVKLPNGTEQWIMVGNLNTSDMIFDPVNNTWIPVNSIQIDYGSFSVYDISGSKIFTSGGYERSDYIANGILLDVKIL